MKNGGPAFPADTEYRENGEWRKDPGMSLRDWFAGIALNKAWNYVINVTDFDSTADNAADLAYAIADAMLAEREKESKE